jgi:hypothetical protein
LVLSLLFISAGIVRRNDFVRPVAGRAAITHCNNLHFVAYMQSIVGGFIPTRIKAGFFMNTTHAMQGDRKTSVPHVAIDIRA